MRLLVLVGCGQLVQSNCRILRLLISLDKLNGYLSFLLHGVNHQMKVSSEANTFGWLWPVVPVVQLDYRIH